jgi:hypothetical protein
MPKHRQRVEELISCGMTLGNISKRIGISEKTLRLHFPDELAHGRALRRAEVIELLYAAARKGDSVALSKLADMTDEDRGADLESPAKPPLRPRLGKKQEAAEAASTAGLGTDWGTDLQTPSIVNCR